MIIIFRFTFIMFYELINYYSCVYRRGWQIIKLEMYI